MTKEEAERLQAAVNEILDEAKLDDKAHAAMGAVNWGDLRCTDVEERRSALYDHQSPVVVMIEEADPGALGLRNFVSRRLAKRGYNDVVVVTEW